MTSILVRFWHEPGSVVDAVRVLRSYARDLASGEETHFATFHGLVAYLAEAAKPGVARADDEDV